MYDWRRALSEALGLGSAGEKPGVAVMRRDEPMAKHTTFAIGGPADVWVQVKTRRALLLVLDFCRTQRVGWRVLGKGSNVLVSDQGLRGVALALGGELAEVSRVPGLGAARGEVVCGAGATLDGVASFAEREGLVGVEFLAGIPGTVGGGLMSNAGAFGRSLGEVVSRVAVIDRNGNERELADSELQRGYRQPMIAPGLLALEVSLKLAEGKPRPASQIREQRWAKHPSEPSAGSFFRNPQPGEGQAPQRVSAGSLIDRCGLKGKSVGRAQVSERHANFLVNTGGAGFVEVYELAQVVKATVEQATGIVLEEEVQYLPDLNEGSRRQ